MLERIEKITNESTIANLSKPESWNKNLRTLVAFDADGTFIDMTKGDHWFTIINEMPREYQERIKKRVNLLGPSQEKWAQQYLSASTFYEFARHGWNMQDIIPFAQKVVVRKEGIQLIRKLTDKHRVVIISYGFKQFLESVLDQYGLSSQVEVFADSIFDVSQGLISPQIDGFIPEWNKHPQPSEEPEKFVSFVQSMSVVPATKGIILDKLTKTDTNIKQILSVGDSSGDLEMFNTTNKLSGISILHGHSDNAPKHIWNRPDFEEFVKTITYICVNKKDSSFTPTANLISDLLL